MQTTVYYKEDDGYLMEKLEREAHQKRMSKSAVILSILEKHYEEKLPPEEILFDMGFLPREDLENLEDNCNRAEIETILDPTSKENEQEIRAVIDKAFDLSNQVD